MTVELFEILASPAGLEGVTARFLHRLQSQVSRWGLPSCRQDQAVRVLHFRGQHGVITVQTDAPSDDILLVVGRASVGRLIEVRGGHVSWDRDVPLRLLEESSDALDREMAGLGLFDAVTGRRRDVLSGRPEVERHFPQPGDAYYLHPDWDADVLLAKFDAPTLLAVVENASGRRILCRKTDAQAVLSASLSDGHFKNMPSA